MGSPKRDRNNDDTVKRLRQSLPDEVRPEALAQLIHELQVHQEEFTAQNTQLIETQQALEETRDRYVNLYDFAPIAFVTISDSGMVREINLTGANLLHRERSRIVGLPFSAYRRLGHPAIHGAPPAVPANRSSDHNDRAGAQHRRTADVRSARHPAATRRE
jgi:hypothetical protein